MTPGIHRHPTAMVFPLISQALPLPGIPTTRFPTPCTIGVTCDPPSDFDIIIETNPNRQDPSSKVSVDSLQMDPATSTLMRGAADKTSGGEPTVERQTNCTLVQNVVNNASPAQMAISGTLIRACSQVAIPCQFFLHLRHTDCVCDADSLVSSAGAR